MFHRVRKFYKVARRVLLCLEIPRGLCDQCRARASLNETLAGGDGFLHNIGKKCRVSPQLHRAAR